MSRALMDAEPVAASLAGLASVLWSRFLRFDAADPAWPDRDRFLVSAADGGRLLHGLLRLTGQVSEGEAPGFGGHAAVEAAPGPPGFGFATAVGMALAERMMAARFGRSLVDHRTWVVAGASELATGISLEAACLAGELRLERLTVLCQVGGYPGRAQPGPAGWGNAGSGQQEADQPGCSSSSWGQAGWGQPSRGQAGTGGGDDILRRFAALGWSVRRVEAGDEAALPAALSAALRGRKPALIACSGAADPGPGRPTPGPGFHEPAADVLRPSGPTGAAAALASAGFVPDDPAEALWHEAGRRGAASRRAWLKRLARHQRRGEFERVLAGRLPEGWQSALAVLRGPPGRRTARTDNADSSGAAAASAESGVTGNAGAGAEPSRAEAARSASHPVLARPPGLGGRGEESISNRVLEALAAAVPELLGGRSGDDVTADDPVAGGLDGLRGGGGHASRHNTGPDGAVRRRGPSARAAQAGAQAGGRVSAGAYGGRHVHWGGRELGMAAALNGVALHGGLIPSVQAPFAAGDVMRPALQLAARMHRRVIAVLTQDDEAASHLPAGNLASLRAVPGLHVLRPADAEEVAQCCELAMRRHDGPSLLVLSRRPAAQALPHEPGPDGRSAAAPVGAAEQPGRCRRGGYVLHEPDGPRHTTLIASGAEVAVAMAARASLAASGLNVAVASLPCWELFAQQEEPYRAGVLGTAPRFGIEAAQGFGWERWLGVDGVFVGADDIAGLADRPTAARVETLVRRRLGLG